MKVTFKQAEDAAKKVVGGLYSMGLRQSTFNVWSPRHNAWWQGQPMPTQKAVESRRRALVCAALEAYGWDALDARMASQDDRWEGRWQVRFRQIVKHAETVG